MKNVSCKNNRRLLQLNKFCVDIFIILYFVKQIFFCLRFQHARLKTYGILDMCKSHRYVGMRDVSEPRCNPRRACGKIYEKLNVITKVDYLNLRNSLRCGWWIDGIQANFLLSIINEIFSFYSQHKNINNYSLILSLYKNKIFRQIS